MFSATQKTLIFLLVATAIISAIAPAGAVTYMWIFGAIILGVLLIVGNALYFSPFSLICMQMSCSTVTESSFMSQISRIGAQKPQLNTNEADELQNATFLP